MGSPGVVEVVVGQTAVVTVGDWLVSRTSPAASTVYGYAAHVRLYLGPYLGQVLLTELTVGQVQACSPDHPPAPGAWHPGVGGDLDPESHTGSAPRCAGR